MRRESFLSTVSSWQHIIKIQSGSNHILGDVNLLTYDVNYYETMST